MWKIKFKISENPKLKIIDSTFMEVSFDEKL
jgi:hypothetical protein